MKLSIKAEKVEIESEPSGSEIIVSLSGVILQDVIKEIANNNTVEDIISELTGVCPLTDIVKALDQEEVIDEIVSNGVGVKGIVDQVEVGPLLDELGADLCKEHFELVDKE